ncbi:hypothetical protein ANAEL_00101 [Anaerolineales bacterium]|nr:hypothetical protein ANAEL_00101 [Anaerolineales bacterium]
MTKRFIRNLQIFLAVQGLHFISGIFDKIGAKLEVKSNGFFGHNMLMVGSPGAGKTLLARALPGILPEMSIEESLDVTRIYSVADQLPAGLRSFVTARFERRITPFLMRVLSA